MYVSEFSSDVIWVLEEVELFIDRDLDYFAIAHIITLEVKSEVFISLRNYLQFFESFSGLFVGFGVFIQVIFKIFCVDLPLLNDIILLLSSHSFKLQVQAFEIFFHFILDAHVLFIEGTWLCPFIHTVHGRLHIGHLRQVFPFWRL